MRKNLIIPFLLFFLLFQGQNLVSSSLEDYTYVPLRRPLRHAEEFYALYRETLHRGTDNLNANAYWLLYALKSPFAPPVQALAKIETPAHWDKYKKLFQFHLYYLLTETNLRLGERYEKNHIFFFNYTYKKEIKEGLEITKIYYQRAKHYWDKVLELSKPLWDLRDIELSGIDGEVDQWQERVFRVTQNYIEVNYPKQIALRLKQVDQKLAMLEKGEYEK